MALYGEGGKRWTMTERARRHGRRTEGEFTIGPSGLSWDGQSLTVEIDEVGMPLPHRVRGRVRVWPQGLCRFSTALDAGGRHRWGPIAPCSRVEVQLESPALSWQGHAYLDSNEGDEPIDRPFVEWDWARATLADGRTAVIYDVRPKQGPDRVIAQCFGADGSASPFAPPIRQPLPSSRWRVPRAFRSEGALELVKTLEDTPFYARSLLDTTLLGERVRAVHESLMLPRVASLPVRLMLPWRMPRRP
ncbi:MAG: carotenoid 1,2-hydratase [Rubrivivax sp.]